MSSTLLVDSSAWIAHYRDELEPDLLRIFTRAMHDGHVMLAPPIWLELIVGFRGPKEKEHLENIRLSAQWLEMPDDLWTRAEQNAVRLHAAGVVLRMPDLLVLTLADSADLKLLHCDKDFDRALKLKDFARLRI
jgi:predicted nucleic acid-binding protein